MTGRCLCGDVRFELRGEPGFVGYCHCTMCQRTSGSAFGANVPVRSDELDWLSGREGIREYESSPGRFRAFCGRCGSPVYSRSAADPGTLRMKLGLFDGDLGVRPGGHFMVDSKAAWFEIADELPRFDEARTRELLQKNQ